MAEPLEVFLDFMISRRKQRFWGGPFEAGHRAETTSSPFLHSPLPSGSEKAASLL